MVRKLSAPKAALVLCVGVTMAADIVVGKSSGSQGVLKSVNAEKNTMIGATEISGDLTADFVIAIGDNTEFKAKDKELAEKLATDNPKCEECFGKPGANVTVLIEGDPKDKAAKTVNHKPGQPAPGSTT